MEQLQEHTKRVIEEISAEGDTVASATTTIETDIRSGPGALDPPRR